MVEAGDDGSPRDLTSGRLLARNAALNLAGKAFPLLVALGAIPFLIDGLGTERFGVLALAWVVIGYFSLFDLGIGRSLTQLVSERLGTDRQDEVAPLARTGLVGTGLLGLVGGGVLWGIAPFVVVTLLNVPADLEAETVSAFRVLAVAVPAVVSTAALRGILEAGQRFGLLNAVLIPMGAFLFLAPLAVLPFSTSLVPVVGSLAVVRLGAWAVFLVTTLRLLPESSEGGDRSAHVRDLLRLGGWMTVSNLVSPLMEYFDRFVIGAVLTLSAVAYYATPFEAITKIVLAPVAVAGVFFPAFAWSAPRRPERTGELFGQSLRTIFVILFPPILIAIAFAPEALELWVGSEFARRGAQVARWLAVGVFFNGLAQVPFALVQGVGRPDVSARFHLLEAPFYFLVLWLGLGWWGITGAAVAWSLRTGMDAVLLFWASARLVPDTRAAATWCAGATAVAGVTFAAAWLPDGSVRSVVVLLGLVTFALVAWTRILRDGEREAVLRWVGGDG